MFLRFKTSDDANRRFKLLEFNEPVKQEEKVNETLIGLLGSICVKIVILL